MIIILIILLLLILIQKSKFEVYNGISWREYRVGDVLYYTNRIANFDEQTLHRQIFLFPGSIAEEYIFLTYPFLEKYSEENIDSLKGSEDQEKIKNSSDNYNIELLNSIINKRINSIPPEDSLVLHIRIGDVLCVFKSENEKYLEDY